MPKMNLNVTYTAGSTNACEVKFNPHFSLKNAAAFILVYFLNEQKKCYISLQI